MRILLQSIFLNIYLINEKIKCVIIWKYFKKFNEKSKPIQIMKTIFSVTLTENIIQTTID